MSGSLQELYEGLRTAHIINVCERNHISWDQAEQSVRIREREMFFGDEATIGECLENWD